MFDILGAIREIFRFSTTLTSSTQRRERYELLLDKKANKALESGETIIHAIDSFLNESISLKQFKVIFKKHRKIFFQND